MLNQVARYAPATEAILDLSPRSILEVGSGSRGIEPYLALDADITACDLSFDDYGASRLGAGVRVRRVVGSVLDLPFEDSSFDVVVAIDLLEHIGPVDRDHALSELIRVGRRRIIVGCPCGDLAQLSDVNLARLHRRLRRPLPGWLKEHLEQPLPDVEDIVTALTGRGRVRIHPNDWLRAHSVVAVLETMPGLWLLSRALAGLLRIGLRAGGSRRRLAMWVAFALRGGDRRPVYRTLFILDKP